MVIKIWFCAFPLFWSKLGSMMCISTPGSEEKRLPSGLVLGHAYTITKVLQIQIEKGPYSGIHNLIRIRNP